MREAVTSGAIGTLAGVAATFGGIEGYEAYLEHQAQAEAPETGPQQAIEDEISIYFDDMDHLEVRPEVLSSGFLLDMEVELVPERLDELSPEAAERVRGSIARISGAVNGGRTMGSGFLMLDGAGETRLMTAGHVVNSMDPDTIVAYNDIGVSFPVVGFESNFVSDSGAHNDIAIGTLANPGDYASRALQARDLGTNPLRPGEQLFLMNFQDGRPADQPITYSNIYLKEFGTSGQVIAMMGDVTPGVEEDDVRPGASGGVVTDANGDVVGITVAIGYRDDNETPLYSCGEDLSMYINESLFGRENVVPFELRVPPTGDECPTGLNQALVRTVGDIATRS